jgi:hypothetical protein
MLKIARGAPDEGTEILRLEGKVVGLWVAELRRSCESALHQGCARLVLDLADVTFIDPDGVALLHELSARGITLTNCSLFSAEQLRIDDVQL